jgi:uncharacterized membrane protein YgcG
MSTDISVMIEASLDKVLRLTSQQAKPKSSAQKPRFGTPYRVAWGNVNVGDVLMFGNQVWRLVAPTAHPGHKMPVLPEAAAPDSTAGSSGASSVSLSTMPSASSGKSSSSTGKPAASSSKPSSSQGGAGASSLHVYTHCLQSLASPGKYEELTLPDNFVVMAVPLLP